MCAICHSTRLSGNGKRLPAAAEHGIAKIRPAQVRDGIPNCIGAQWPIAANDGQHGLRTSWPARYGVTGALKITPAR